MQRARSFLVVSLAAFAACRHLPPPPSAPTTTLDNNSSAALAWVDANAAPVAIADSARPLVASAALGALVGDARVIGVSEMTEGTDQFGFLMRRLLSQLVQEQNVRALAIQAPMGEAMDIDHYVRGAAGDPRRLLRSLNAEHWNTRDMLELLAWLRSYNASRPANAQIGFYGFELPDLVRAENVVTGLSQTTTGAALSAWLKRSYVCVRNGVAANWGREGRAVDSTYWTPCRGTSAAVTDSLVALEHRLTDTAAIRSVRAAEDFSRLVQHGVITGLQRLSRAPTVAEHIEWVASNLAPGERLLLWGRDVEAGRLTLDSTTVQSAVPLSQALGDKYRNVAFAVGVGAIRAVYLTMATRADAGTTDVPLAVPAPGTYEDVFWRASPRDFLLDMRHLPADSAGAWLHGPRPLRLVNGQYAPTNAPLFQTKIAFPKNFDGVLFVRTVTPAVGM